MSVNSKDTNAKVGQANPSKRVRKRDFKVNTDGQRRAIPWPQRERVKQKFVAGKKMRQIAREEGIDPTSVAKIVKEKDVAQHVQDLREKFYGRLEEAMEAAFTYVKTENGGRLAYEMMRDAGIVGAKPANVAPQTEIEIETEEQAVERIAVAIVKGAIEKHKFFGIPLPEADEVEEEIEKEKARKGATE